MLQEHDIALRIISGSLVQDLHDADTFFSDERTHTIDLSV